MQLRRYQKGMSIWQLSYVLGSLFIFGMVAMKSFPIYAEHINVDKNIKGTASDGSADPQAIRSELYRRWAIDDIKNLDPKDVKVIRVDNGAALSYTYDASVDLFGNAKLVFHFEGKELIKNPS